MTLAKIGISHGKTWQLGSRIMGEDGEPTGIKLPYVVTIEENSREVLSIKRNYEVGDPLRNKVDYFVHFKFLLIDL